MLRIEVPILVWPLGGLLPVPVTVRISTAPYVYLVWIMDTWYFCPGGSLQPDDL